MKSQLITNEGGKSLLIFFAGWSLSPESLTNFRPKGWDILFIYDYTDLNFPVEAITNIMEYEKYALIAHSFGVAVAHTFLEQLPKMEVTIAVCGTLQPINDHFGIPSKVFNFTVKSIGKEGINTFNKRMCGGNIKYFTPSKLSFNEQIKALELLGNTFKNSEVTAEDKKLWRVAIINMQDEIIPVDNQIAFWGDSATEVLGFKTQPHYPFTPVFSQFINTILP